MPIGGDLGGSVGGILGGVAVAAGLGGKGGDKERKAALNVWKKLELSSFDMRALSPPEISLLAEAFPELYSEVIVGQAPEVTDSPEIRQITVRNLQHMEQIAQEGLPTSERLAAETAQRRVASASDRAQDQVLRDMAERNRLGAGDELAARLAAQQGSQNLAAQQGADLAMQGSQMRVGATSQAAQIAEGLRGQDIGRRGMNANLMARFNEMSSQLGTQRAQDNAAARERAQAYNVGTRQRVGEANEGARYQTALDNLQRQNALRGVSFGQRLAKTTGLSNAYLTNAAAEDEKRRNREQAIVGAGRGAGQIGGSFAGF